MNLDSYLKCECGKHSEAFSFMVSAGYSRTALIENFQKFEPELISILPRLRCGNCRQRGLVRLHTKTKMSTKPMRKRVPFSQRLVATDRGLDRIFHRQTCGYAKKIRREDEVFFETREDAILRKFDPCRSCRP